MARPLTDCPETYAWIEKLVGEGHTPAEIHRITGVTPGTVIRYFPLAGAFVPHGEWTDVPGWPEYAVTPDGLIRANAKTSASGRRLRERLLKPVTHPGYGHQLVYFTREGRTVTKQLGRVVLETFKGSPSTESLECRHLDGNPLNNRIENLEWGTHYENMQDMVRHGSRKRDTCIRGHLFKDGNLTWNSKGYRVCRACRIAQQRAKTEGRPFNEDESHEVYQSLMSAGVPSPTLRSKLRREHLTRMMDDGVSLSELCRTTGADYRTVRGIDPDYKPFEVGGAGMAAILRRANHIIDNAELKGTK